MKMWYSAALMLSLAPLALSLAAKDDTGIVTIASRHSHRPQRRGGESGNDDASDQIADLRESQGRHSLDAGCSKHRHRPAIEVADLGRRQREGVALLQQSKLSC